MAEQRRRWCRCGRDECGTGRVRRARRSLLRPGSPRRSRHGRRCCVCRCRVRRPRCDAGSARRAGRGCLRRRLPGWPCVLRPDRPGVARAWFADAWFDDAWFACARRAGPRWHRPGDAGADPGSEPRLLRPDADRRCSRRDPSPRDAARSPPDGRGRCGRRNGSARDRAARDRTARTAASEPVRTLRRTARRYARSAGDGRADPVLAACHRDARHRDARCPRAGTDQPRGLVPATDVTGRCRRDRCRRDPRPRHLRRAGSGIADRRSRVPRRSRRG